MQRAVREAVSPEDLAIVLGRLRRIAVDSPDEQAAIGAARLLLERVLGKPPESPRLIEDDLEIGEVCTAKDLAAARRRLLSAALGGGVDLRDLPTLSQALDGTGEAELAALTDRIEAIERSQGS